MKKKKTEMKRDDFIFICQHRVGLRWVFEKKNKREKLEQILENRKGFN